MSLVSAPLASMLALVGTPVSSPTLSEILINPPGTDDGQEFIEIRGDPSTPLTGHWLLVLEGDPPGANTGGIDQRIDLGALSTGANGLLLIRDSATVLSPAPAAGTSVVVIDFAPDIENGANTFVLGFGTPPALGTDLDADNDGTLDAGALAGFTLVDSVSITVAGVGLVYADELSGYVFPALAFTPGALYRIYDVAGLPVRWSGGVVGGAGPGPYPWTQPSVFQLGSCLLNPGNLNENDFVELEPNGPKAEATLVDCLAAGDSICGTTTGTSMAAMSSVLTSADTFRIKTCPLPLAIYRHELLLLDGTGGTAHGATIRGLDQMDPGVGMPGVVDTASDTLLQTSVDTGGGDLNAWYGFGRGEELYLRITGVAATTLPYTATLTTSPVAPIVVPATFRAGPIVFEFDGQGHLTDAEIHLFDSNLVVLDDASNDQNIFLGGTDDLPHLERVLGPGTYYAAVGRWNVATNDNSPADDLDKVSDVLDFPDGIVAGNPGGPGADVAFAITDCTGTTVPVPHVLPAGEWVLSFFQITVVSGLPYCFGDGSGTPCPCGNAGAAGNGCANSANALGANLVASGIARIGGPGIDTLVLAGSGMPSKSCFYYQGTNRHNGGAGIVFGDGLRCAGGVPVLLGYRLNMSGASSFGPPLGPSVSMAGGVMAPGTQTYQVTYQDTAAYCTPSQFNHTNGLNVCWSL